MTWKLCVDGASRGNPGPSGAGVYLVKDANTFLKKGYFLNRKTNNEAEYLALIVGIYLFKKAAHADEKLTVYSDSQLLIKQMTGEYRVRKPELQVMFACVKREIESIHCSFHHIYREKNTQADALANQGIDTKTPLPSSLIALLRTYEIHI